MQLDLNKIEPTNPTEVVLKYYAQYLEGKLASIQPKFFEPFDKEPMIMKLSEINNVIARGVVMGKIQPSSKYGGYWDVTVQTIPLKKSENGFWQSVMCVQNFQDCTDTMRINMMDEMMRTAMREIATLYTKEKP